MDYLRTDLQRAEVQNWVTYDDNIQGTSIQLPSLQCGSTYQFRILAHGDGVTYADAWGDPSTPITRTTQVCREPEFDQSSYSGSIHENAPVGTVILMVTATDPNGDPVEYTIHSGNNAGKFGIGTHSGVITLEEALDRSIQSSYTLSVRANDPAGNYGTATAYITVLEPQLPEAPAPANILRTGATVNSITLQWQPVKNTSKYRVQYRLNSTHGWSTSTSSANTTSHTIGSLACGTEYQVRVTAHGDGVVYHRDWGTDSGTQTMSTAVCPNPVFINEPCNFEVSERVLTGHLVGVVTATDPTPGDLVQYSIMNGNNAGKFAINANSGQVTVAGTLDADVGTPYTLTVTATDTSYYTDTATVSITVLKNAPPVIDSLTYDFSVRDDAALGTSVGYVSATDPENDPITYSFFAGHIEEDFNINAGTGEITVADPLNAVAIDEYVFLVQAFDGTSNAFTSVAVDVIDSAPCDGGTAVPDPGNNVALVADCQIMRGLQDDLAGDGTLNWSGRLAMTSWDGVTIAGTPSRVTEINLGSRSLQGVVPAGLGSLSALEVLDLNFNLLTGEIPAELGNLSSLTRLSLHVNALSGEMPTELGNLANLQELDLNFNYLNGPIPTQLGQLTELTLLNLSTNRLTGPVPTELGSLTNLVTLWLYDNRLTGSVPASLTALTSLQALHIADNRFTGCLPAALRSITFNDLAQLNLPDC